MRTLSGHLTTMYAQTVHRRARCLWLRLFDGTVFGFTDHDCDLTIDLPDISDVPVLFRADQGVLPSDVSTTVGLESGNFDVEGPIGEAITRIQLMGRRFNRAEARLFEVDWNQSFPDICPILAGQVGDVRIKGSTRYVLEVRSDADRFNMVIGRLIAPWCDAEFGDARCRAVVPTVTALVTSAVNEYQFGVDIDNTYPDKHFVFGRVQFLTGALAGTREVEIFDFDGYEGLVELLVPLAEVPEIGDQLVLKRGCSKLKKSDDPEMPTCAYWQANGNPDQVMNFRGMDRVPGTDRYIRIPVPGEEG